MLIVAPLFSPDRLFAADQGSKVFKIIMIELACYQAWMPYYVLVIYERPELRWAQNL